MEGNAADVKGIEENASQQNNAKHKASARAEFELTPEKISRRAVVSDWTPTPESIRRQLDALKFSAAEDAAFAQWQAAARIDSGEAEVLFEAWMTIVRAAES
jgi:hypothetical protein